MICSDRPLGRRNKGSRLLPYAGIGPNDRPMRDLNGELKTMVVLKNHLVDS